MSKKPITYTSSGYDFYSKSQYFEDIITRISNVKKGGRVSLATMSYDSEDPYVNRINQALVAAASRGVKVILMVDAFIFLTNEGILPGPLFYRKKLPSKVRGKFRTNKISLDALEKAGGSYVVTNLPSRPFTLPFIGRSHIKFGIINDRVYIGGCNLSDTKQIDIMTGWDDKKTADYLFNLAEKTLEIGSLAKVLNGKDTSIDLENGAKIYIDSGEAGRSVIYETALSMIDAAEKQLYFICKYFPNDKTVEKLAAASKRDVDIDLIFNHPSKNAFPFNLLHYFVLYSEKIIRPRALFSGQLPKSNNYLHAKLLVTDDGTLIGSHNYVAAGVKFGTAEIALMHPDPSFGRMAIQTLGSLIREKNI